jgi:hypothetical protein
MDAARLEESIKKSFSAFIATPTREDKMVQHLPSVNLPWVAPFGVNAATCCQRMTV